MINPTISTYIEMLEANVLNDLALTNHSNLYALAEQLIEQHPQALKEICQAYEVVKHRLVGLPMD